MQQEINPLSKNELNTDELKKFTAFNAARRNKYGVKVYVASGCTWIISKMHTFFIVRVINHFFQENGLIISAGIAFYFFFSSISGIYGIIAIIYISQNREIEKYILYIISSAAPGLLKSSYSNGLFSYENFTQEKTNFSIAVIISIFMSISTGLNILSYLRLGVRAMFGLKPPAINCLLQKFKDMLFAILIIFTVYLISIFRKLTKQLIEEINFFDENCIYFIFKVPFFEMFLYVCIICVIINLVSNIRAPYQYIIPGAIVGSLLLTGLRIVGIALISTILDQYSVLSPFTVPLILLLWFNIAIIIILICASIIKIIWNDKYQKINIKFIF